jgi:prepilin-type N-terminal cleavage/methylation domain-containing protein
MPHDRRGLTLIELLVTVLVAGFLAAGVTSLLLSSNRFEEKTESLRNARRVSRAGVAALSSDLRMVDPSWGVEAASASSITLRVPYALGLVCTPSVLAQTIAILPVDSVVLATPGYSGVAVRLSDGTWSHATNGVLTEAATWPNACTTAGISAITAPSGAPNQRTRAYTVGFGTVIGSPLTVGSVIVLYRRTRYYFGVSAQTGLTGRTALWRQYLDSGSGAVELAAPFDATAAFRFYDLAATTAQDAVPSPLTNMRGIELFLPGESDRTARQRTAPEQADLRTAIFFVNRLN